MRGARNGGGVSIEGAGGETRRVKRSRRSDLRAMERIGLQVCWRRMPGGRGVFIVVMHGHSLTNHRPLYPYNICRSDFDRARGWVCVVISHLMHSPSHVTMGALYG